MRLDEFDEYKVQNSLATISTRNKNPNERNRSFDDESRPISDTVFLKSFVH